MLDFRLLRLLLGDLLGSLGGLLLELEQQELAQELEAHTGTRVTQ